MSFAVLAWGGCGTHWLARELGRARGWAVPTEPAPNDQRDLCRRYEHGGERYGEVNPKARHVVHFAALYGARLAAVTRDPYRQLRSCFLLNRWTGASADVMLEDYARTSAGIDLFRARGGPVYRFEDLVDPATGALVRLAADLGVPLDPAAVDWTPERESLPGELAPDVEEKIAAFLDGIRRAA